MEIVMTRNHPLMLASLAATALLALVLAAAPALADASPPTPPVTPTTPAPPPPDSGSGDKKGTDDKSKPKAIEATATMGYAEAYDRIYQRADFVGGIAALRTVGEDDNADVATLMGYASRKLGRYDEARYWYDKALAADPNHVRTLEYYGAWHAEQGNKLKAADFLAKIALLCGTGCKEYRELKGALDSVAGY
jgi:tetratricopeptide (TPR) repeat protein